MQHSHTWTYTEDDLPEPLRAPFQRISADYAPEGQLELCAIGKVRTAEGENPWAEDIEVRLKGDGSALADFLPSPALAAWLTGGHERPTPRIRTLPGRLMPTITIDVPDLLARFPLLNVHLDPADTLVLTGELDDGILVAGTIEIEEPSFFHKPEVTPDEALEALTEDAFVVTFLAEQIEAVNS